MCWINNKKKDQVCAVGESCVVAKLYFLECISSELEFVTGLSGSHFAHFSFRPLFFFPRYQRLAGRCLTIARREEGRNEERKEASQ